VQRVDDNDETGRERKAYVLTQLGKGILEAETARMQTLVAITRERSSQGGTV
jgi:hypothetical protein